MSVGHVSQEPVSASDNLRCVAQNPAPIDEHGPRVTRGPAPAGERVPVVIIGAGACGLTAAWRLGRAGIECVLIERDAVPSGSTALSSGFIPAAGTRAQQLAGVTDSPAEFAADIHAKAHGQAAPHLVTAYTEAIPQAIDALQEAGLTFEVLDGFLYPGHHARRMHSLPDRTGAALVGALANTATEAGAYLLTDTIARELWCDADGRISAVGCDRPDGGREVIGCDVLLLACNGFGGNVAMRRKYLPAMADAEYGGHVGNDGSAVQWGLQLGARLADMGGYQGHGSWAIPQGALISWAVIMDGGVQINRAGKRFHDETQGYSEAAVHVLAQPEGVAWNVFDAHTLALLREFPDFRDAEAGGALRCAADAAALADIIGCDETTLTATLASVSHDLADALGRRFTRRLEAPYYAIKVTGALFHTQGGLDIDAQCRVLSTNGDAFPNLLAAGGAARGVSGNEVSGYLSGNGLLSAVAGGYIAAATAAELLGRPL